MSRSIRRIVVFATTCGIGIPEVSAFRRVYQNPTEEDREDAVRIVIETRTAILLGLLPDTTEVEVIIDYDK